MAKEAKATLSQIKGTSKPRSSSTETITCTTTQLPTSQTCTEPTTVQLDSLETIDISDDDSLPITSANSFLTHLSNSKTEHKIVTTALEPS